MRLGVNVVDRSADHSSRENYMDNTAATSEWYSVEDRLPEDNRFVLAWHVQRCYAVTAIYVPKRKTWRASGMTGGSFAKNAISHWADTIAPPGCKKNNRPQRFE
jgi:hypothetical protein